MAVWVSRIEFSDYLLVGNSLLVLCHIKPEKSYFSRKSNDISVKESHPETHQENWFSLGISLKHDDVKNQNKPAALCFVGFIGGVCWAIIP